MKARKILKIYLVLFYLTFMTSVLGVAQQFKKLKNDKLVYDISCLVDETEGGKLIKVMKDAKKEFLGVFSVKV
jgi:hypothetical protein